jgi:hypothetical protein
MKMDTWSKQSQTKPICSACPAKPRRVGRSRELACPEQGRSVESILPLFFVEDDGLGRASAR